jgi:hypothetical protein
MTIDAVLVGSLKSADTGPITTVGGTTQASGSTFVVAVSFDNGASISTVTDSKSNAYTQIGTTQANAGSAHKKALYRCENGTGGASHTATVAFTGGSAFGTVYLIEITGAAAASFDQTAQGADTSSPYTLTLPVLSQADEVIITLHGSGQGGTVTYLSSNTTIFSTETDGLSYWTSAVSKVVVSSTSAFTPSFTGGDTATAQIAGTFKAAGGGSSGVLRRRALSGGFEQMGGMSG